ncbi:MAG: hypothetical protein J6Y69_08795 [Treponema sp.]|nr:hypothetical protein [Treponema sp.]
MTRRPVPFLLLLLIPAIRMNAETVLVAPMAVYDKDSNAISMTRNPAEEIFDVVSDHWFEGMLTFRMVSSRKYGEIYTTLDANRCCAAEDAEYILFGYVQQNEGSWIASMKLYDASSKKTAMEFFSGDDLNHYERLMGDLSEKILAGLEEAAGLNRSDVLNARIRPFEAKLPLSAFWWSPVAGGWNKRLTGIAGLDIQLELYPKQPKISPGGHLIDFSLRPGISDSFALGTDGSYPVIYDAVSIVLPFCAHFHFDMRNSLYIGTGPYYEIQLMSYSPKYMSGEFHWQNMFGLEALAGYEFAAGENIDLFTEVRLDFHFSRDSYLAIKTALGASFRLYRGKP